MLPSGDAKSMRTHASICMHQTAFSCFCKPDRRFPIADALCSERHCMVAHFFSYTMVIFCVYTALFCDGISWISMHHRAATSNLYRIALSCFCTAGHRFPAVDDLYSEKQCMAVSSGSCSLTMIDESTWAFC